MDLVKGILRFVTSLAAHAHVYNEYRLFCVFMCDNVCTILHRILNEKKTDRKKINKKILSTEYYNILKELKEHRHIKLCLCALFFMFIQNRDVKIS